MKTLEIIITTEGKATVQTLGYTGSTCRDASKFLEEALGQRTAEHRTAEFHQQDVMTEQTQQQRT